MAVAAAWCTRGGKERICSGVESIRKLVWRWRGVCGEGVMAMERQERMVGI